MKISNIEFCYKMLLFIVLAGLGSFINCYLIASGHCHLQSFYMGFLIGLVLCDKIFNNFR